MSQINSDSRFMMMALALARRGSGMTRPNPMVGAVVVRDGAVVGRGWHVRAGAKHAEVVALDEAGELAKGATLYVTLEPCNHFGKTPPCTERVIAAGLKRVVIALRDPNPKVKGGGVEKLRQSGIEVELGVMSGPGEELNLGWLHWVETGHPLVLLKLAVSLDGKIASATNESKWITSATARAQVHRLRRHADAILVGSQTVLSDNSRLTNRTGRGSQPLRVMLDSQLRVPTSLNIYSPLGLNQDGPSPILLVATTAKASFQSRKEAELAGAEVLVLEGKDQRVDLEALLRNLGERGIQTVLCEGGGELATALLTNNLVHRFLLYQSPILLGAEGKTFYTRKDIQSITEAQRLKLITFKRVGRDTLSIFAPTPQKAR